MDAPPVFEPGEEVFDLVALTVELFIEVSRHCAPPSRRDARGDALCRQGGAVFIAVIALVTDHNSWALRKRRVEQLCSLVVTHLTFCQTQRDGPALAIAHGMKLGVQTTFGAPDTSG